MARKTKTALAALRHDWEHCTRCFLARTRERLLFYRGSLTAKLLFVGDLPDDYEDAEGELHVGRAGRYLDELVRGAGIKPSQRLIANVLGCRPPHYRTPALEELKACRPRLASLVQVVRPRAIVLVGNVAAEALAGVRHVSCVHGQQVTVTLATGRSPKVYPAVPVYHPNYLLHSGKPLDLRREAISDLRAAFRLAYY
jgi:DNA polymerase